MSKLRGAVLCAVAAAVVVSGSVAMPAAATSVASVQQVARHKPKPVTTCTGLGDRSPGASAYSDRTLWSVTERLVCSVIIHGTINIKSWFIIPDKTVQPLINDLKIMWRYRKVRVNVLVGRSYYTAKSYAAFRKAFWFAHVYTCAHGCDSTNKLAISHSKFITVSKVRGRRGGPTVLSTSENWSNEQIRITHEDGVLSWADHKLTAAFVNEFAHEVRCSRGRCVHYTPEGQWIRGDRTVSVAFTPARRDLIADELDSTTCQRGAHVDVVALAVSRPRIVYQLNRLAHQGCQVRLITEYSPGYTPCKATASHHCMLDHSKFIIIVAKHRYEVLSGSQNFDHSSLAYSDNQMVRTTNSNVVKDYERFFGWDWNHSMPKKSKKHSGATAAVSTPGMSTNATTRRMELG